MSPMWPRSLAVSTTPTPWMSQAGPGGSDGGRDLGFVGLDPLVEAPQVRQQVTGEVTPARVGDRGRPDTPQQQRRFGRGKPDLPSCHAASTHVSAVIRVAAAGAESGGICDGSSRRRFGGENILRTRGVCRPRRRRVGQSSRGRSGRSLSACSQIQPDSEAHARCHATSSAR
jgi:hypothetical protein